MTRPAPIPGQTPWARALLISVAGVAAVAVVLLAFIWPTRTSTAKDLPVLVVGSSPLAAQANQQLSASGVFVVEQAASRDDAVRGIGQREAYAAIGPPTTPGGEIEILTATAASPVVAQQLGQVAAQLTQQSAQAAAQFGMPAPTVTVTDLAPLTPDDSRGAGLALTALPLAMGGMIGGVLISFVVIGAWRRVAATLSYGILGGLTLAAILGPWLGILPQFAPSAAVIGLALTAIAATIVGLHSLIGQPGIALGAIITLFIGNPLSSASAPVEFLPTPWGAIGQFFVPGAGVTALRLENYFPDANSTAPWLVLGAWAVVGLILTIVGHTRGAAASRPAHSTDAQPAADAQSAAKPPVPA